MTVQQELLNFVYQNSEMGAGSIARLSEHTQDEAFLAALREQRREYLCINAAARDALCRAGCDERGLSSLEKLRTYLCIDLQSMTDTSTVHLAGMMILGSTMGIIDAHKKLRRFADTQQGEGQVLMRRLCEMEEKNIESMKRFL